MKRFLECFVPVIMFSSFAVSQPGALVTGEPYRLTESGEFLVENVWYRDASTRELERIDRFYLTPEVVLPPNGYQIRFQTSRELFFGDMTYFVRVKRISGKVLNEGQWSLIQGFGICHSKKLSNGNTEVWLC